MTQPVASGFIQWKGTDVCIGFVCLCNTDLHFDGEFAYAIRCWKCNRVWEPAVHIPLRLVDQDFVGVVQDTAADHTSLNTGVFQDFDPAHPWLD